jgi:hypothetical protein
MPSVPGAGAGSFVLITDQSFNRPHECEYLTTPVSRQTPGEPTLKRRPVPTVTRKRVVECNYVNQLQYLLK